MDAEVVTPLNVERLVKIWAEIMEEKEAKHERGDSVKRGDNPCGIASRKRYSSGDGGI